MRNPLKPRNDKSSDKDDEKRTAQVHIPAGCPIDERRDRHAHPLPVWRAATEQAPASTRKG